MPQTTSPNSANKRYLLLDSCIAEYWLNRYMQPAISGQIKTWAGQTFDLAISEISYAELIDGAHKDKINRVKTLLLNFTSLESTQRILIGAGFLGSIYKTKDEANRNISLGDKIIATTAFIYNLPIITANVKDFPHPFFTSIASENIFYTKRSRKHVITIDILNPNFTSLNYWHSRMS